VQLKYKYRIPDELHIVILRSTESGINKRCMWFGNHRSQKISSSYNE